jgi:threonine dehydratase
MGALSTGVRERFLRHEMAAARERLGSRVRRTACRRSESLGRLVDGEVSLKLENTQETGSFKIRGVLNKIASLGPADRRRTLVSASTGNHGAAFAHAVRELGLDGRLFMPRTASEGKRRWLESTGLPLELVGDDCVEAELAAAAYALERDAVWISPYNDLEVIQGQGTVAAELLEQIESFDDVLVPVGGGGLIAGIAGCLDAAGRSVRVIGCQPRNSCVMARSVEAGVIVEAPSLPTLSDATAGGVEPGAVTFELCRDLVDDFVLVDEDEIASAIRRLHEEEDLIVEGAAALTVAALLRERRRLAGRRVVLVLSGGRIDAATLRRIGCAPEPAADEEEDG